MSDEEPKTFHTKLISYGAGKTTLQEADAFPELTLARVIAQYKGLYRIVTEDAEGLAEVSGKFRHDTEAPSDFPAVGDFVLADRSDASSGNAIIHRVLSRKSVFGRSAVDSPTQTQIVATNIDTIFICMSLNNDFNLNRLERYLSLAWSSQATPVIVLTKADLCLFIEDRVAEVSSIAFGVDVIITSSEDEASYALLFAHLSPGLTASFIGSSGVGKSTLINRLAGEDLLETSHIRSDDKGRHTTTRRDLLLLPQGSLVIDTPGMRELGVEPADLSQSFSDIEYLTRQCRFNDCSHTNEPGCALQVALASGDLDQRRFDNYLKLQKEAGYEGLSSRQIEAKKIESMVGGFGEMKQLRTRFKKENERRGRRS